MQGPVLNNVELTDEQIFTAAQVQSSEVRRAMWRPRIAFLALQRIIIQWEKLDVCG